MSDPSPAALTKHDLYERCVQSPRHISPFIDAIYGEPCRVLGEDFAGTAALSHDWVGRGEDRFAIATDLDADALSYHGEHDRINRLVADVMTIESPCDALYVGNFSIGYWHTRSELVAYLKHALARLRTSRERERPASPSPVFICDTYGGETAYQLSDVHRDHWIDEGPHKGKRVRYTWEQREADPLTGMVTNACHFRVDQGGVIELELEDAFVYRWRLWSVPELRDAMLEAGFAAVNVYDKTPGAIDEEGTYYITPLEDPAELDETFIVYVAARF